MDWKTMLSKACDYSARADDWATRAVREIARQKGFSDEQILLFNGQFATGYEVLVIYSDADDGREMLIETMAGMTKSEIMSYFSIS